MLQTKTHKLSLPNSGVLVSQNTGAVRMIYTTQPKPMFADGWSGDDNRNEPADRWPEQDPIRGYEPAEQYTDLRYDPATDNGYKQPDEDRNFWDRL
jgi:hypothetical protein